jgi:Mu transposase, C-terminal domain
VVHPDTGKVTTSYAAVAKHFGVQVKPCPPRRGNRKGVVEKANHTAAQRWWRTLPDDVTVAQAQARLDAFCAEKTDTRIRVIDDTGTRCSVGALAVAERLRPVPAAAFPVVVAVQRTITAQALVSFRGNRYSVPPELTRTDVTVQHRLGSPVLSIVTGSGVVVAVHHRVADGTGATVRTDTHVTALSTAVLAAFSTDRPHHRKQRIPPGPAALAAADRLRRTPPAAGAVIDLSVYAAAAARRSTLP